MRTGAHSLRVQRFAVELLDSARSGALDQGSASLRFLLHDIGKIAIPDGTS